MEIAPLSQPLLLKDKKGTKQHKLAQNFKKVMSYVLLPLIKKFIRLYMSYENAEDLLQEYVGYIPQKRECL